MSVFVCDVRVLVCAVRVFVCAVRVLVCTVRVFVRAVGYLILMKKKPVFVIVAINLLLL